MKWHQDIIAQKKEKEKIDCKPKSYEIKIPKSAKRGRERQDIAQHYAKMHAIENKHHNP